MNVVWYSCYWTAACRCTIDQKVVPYCPWVDTTGHKTTMAPLWQQGPRLSIPAPAWDCASGLKARMCVCLCVCVPTHSCPRLGVFSLFFFCLVGCRPLGAAATRQAKRNYNLRKGDTRRGEEIRRRRKKPSRSGKERDRRRGKQLKRPTDSRTQNDAHAKKKREERKRWTMTITFGSVLSKALDAACINMHGLSQRDTGRHRGSSSAWATTLHHHHLCLCCSLSLSFSLFASLCLSLLLSRDEMATFWPVSLSSLLGPGADLRF